MRGRVSEIFDKKKQFFCRNIQYDFYIIEKIIDRISHIMQKGKKSETWTLCDKMKKNDAYPNLEYRHTI
jgi:hypothetical protein